MSDLRITETTGDIELVSGDLILTVNEETIDQHVRANLRSFKGEWFLNLDDGVPYYQEILKKNQSPVIVDAILKEAILNSYGVTELTAFDIKVDTETRKLFLTFEVNTIEGFLSFENLEL